LNERIRLRKTCERFFTTAQYDIPMWLKCIKVFIAKLRKKAGFHFSAHSLRHSFATLMLEWWCDIFSLSKMLGHNKITTTTIYLACSAQQLMRSIEKHPLN
jgi:site-specific recombinase XerD